MQFPLRHYLKYFHPKFSNRLPKLVIIYNNILISQRLIYHNLKYIVYSYLYDKSSIFFNFIYHQYFILFFIKLYYLTCYS